MDESHASNTDEPLHSDAPIVVIFFRRGGTLSARIRDVATQKQWILANATPLQELLDRSGALDDA